PRQPLRRRDRAVETRQTETRRGGGGRARRRARESGSYRRAARRLVRAIRSRQGGPNVDRTRRAASARRCAPRGSCRPRGRWLARVTPTPIVPQGRPGGGAVAHARKGVTERTSPDLTRVCTAPYVLHPI